MRSPEQRRSAITVGNIGILTLGQEPLNSRDISHLDRSHQGTISRGRQGDPAVEAAEERRDDHGYRQLDCTHRSPLP